MRLNCVNCNAEVDVNCVDVEYNLDVECIHCNEIYRANVYTIQLLAALMEDYDERQEA